MLIKLTQGYLAAVILTVRVRSGVILQDMDAITPVHLVKVVPKSTYGAGQTGAPLKEALSFANIPGEAELIELGEVFLLSDQ